MEPGVGNLFFIGSNPDPETGPSYLSAADCGIPDPTPTGDLGFPDMHIVMNVNGSCPSGSPTPTTARNAKVHSIAEAAPDTGSASVTPSPTVSPTPTVRARPPR